MPIRSYWKGFLKLSLVTCPVEMSPATTGAEKVRFHTLNRATGNRVRAENVDSVTGKPVEEEDERLGYEREPGTFVTFEDEELEAVALDSVRTIDIERFVPRDSVGWIWYDKPHFLVPDGEVGEEAFAVIREAMTATGTHGIARLVLYRRERAVMIQPRDQGMLLWTLRYGDEVRPAEDHFRGSAGKVEAPARKMVEALIQQRTSDWDPKFVTDPVQRRLRQIIAAKSAKKPARKAAKPPPEPEPPSNVINIMDALRKSIAASEQRKPRR